MINYGYVNHQAKFIETRPILQTSINLVLFGKKMMVILGGNCWASLVAQLVKNPPAMWEIWVRTLGWEEPPGEEKGYHSRILAWRIPRTV